jgi:FkbM family methyltransferase
MRFDNPAWQQAPVRTGLRVLTSLVRKRIGPLRTARVPYDGGRTSIHADLSTPLGLLLYRYGNRDTDIELVKQLLSPGDVFVDGGANVGLFTLAAAARVGRSGKVIAFEPAREVRLRLTENVALNRLVQVEIVPFALSAAPGEASFRSFDIAGAGLNHLSPVEGEGGHVESVTLTTLDTAISPTDRRRLRLIKLDLEGAEHAALRGASEILRDVRPDIVVEIEGAHLARLGSSVREVADLLRAHGYQFFEAKRADGGTLRLSRLDEQLTSSKTGPNVFATANLDEVLRKGVRVD